MQWILQDFEDTRKLAEALERKGLSYSWHKVVPLIGELQPEPDIDDPADVVFFGSYSLWRYAKERGLRPGVIKLRPFVHQTAWHPYLLNGASALFSTLRALPSQLPKDDRSWFLRPFDDSKAEPGRVRSTAEILELVNKVLALAPEEIPDGSLCHDTELMLTRPMQIEKEWRLWVVDDQIVTFSLYKEGSHVIYRQEIDADAMSFARRLVAVNPNYAKAYVLDVCRTTDGLAMLETNCINAAGFYAADLDQLVRSLEASV